MIETLDNVFSTKKHGVIYCDDKLRVLRLNTTAKSLIASSDCISIRNSKLTATQVADHQNLILNCKRVISNQNHRILFFKSKKEKLPCRLDIYPILERDIHLNSRDFSTMILLNASSKSQQFFANEFKAFFDLTQSETYLVKSLQQGISVNGHAEVRKIKITTARWTLGNVFSKTGTKSQSELKELITIFSL